MISRATLLYVRTVTAMRAVADRDEGASMVEYALLVSLIAMAAIGAVVFFGEALRDKYEAVADSVANA
ncbi:MAG: Flp family type IVb pilin [Acidimicrobiia bacterium]